MHNDIINIYVYNLIKCLFAYILLSVDHIWMIYSLYVIPLLSILTILTLANDIFF